MHIYHLCEKYTVSVHCRRRTIALIVSFIGYLLDTNINLSLLDVTVSLLCNDYKRIQGIFYLLLYHRGRIHLFVCVHITNLLQLFHYCSLGPVSKNINTLLHVEMIYHHDSHYVSFYLLL